MQFLKVPKERVAVLIGAEGEIKAYIEKKTGAALEIDSETGDVTINTEKVEDPVMILKVVDIVKAIARGFSPERAYRLFNDDIYFESLDIREYVGNNPNRLAQVRARLIGTNGRTRGVIEELTNSQVSIFGNTVAIIGYDTEIATAHKALEMILHGSEHATVYKFLERKRRESKLAEMGFDLPV